MKPGDHPEFFRFPAPEGRSRESTIVLSRQGTFYHEGEPILHPAMARAFATWLRRHPDDDRYILSNGYDWTYITVLGTPFFVTSLRIVGEPATLIELTLSDGTQEQLAPETLREDNEGALVCDVKEGAFSARLIPSAQTALSDVLVTTPQGHTALVLDGREYIPAIYDPSA